MQRYLGNFEGARSRLHARGSRISLLESRSESGCLGGLQTVRRFL